MSGDVLLATSAAGVARAERVDDGSWDVERTLPDVDARCLAADPLAAGRAFAGTQRDGLFVTDDAGRSWRRLDLPEGTVKSVAASRAEPDLVFAGTKPAKVYASRDGGESWAELEGFRHAPGRWHWWSPAEPPGIGYVQTLALSPTDPDVVHAGIEVGGVVSSFDGGRTWAKAAGAIEDCHTLATHPTDGARVYQGGAGLGAAASVSEDGGLTFRKLPTPRTHWYGWAAAADPEDGRVVYWSASPGPGHAHRGRDAEAAIYRSTDGRDAERLAGGLPQPLDHMPYALVTDPRAPGRVLAGLDNGDVWESRDRGGSWRRLAVDLGHIYGTMTLLGTP